MKRSILLPCLFLVTTLAFFALRREVSTPPVATQPSGPDQGNERQLEGNADLADAPRSVDRIIGGVSNRGQLISGNTGSESKLDLDDQPGQAGEKDGFVLKVLAEKWTDPAGKAGRRRVRIVEADFKYPNIRLEEEVWTDSKTGKQTVNRLLASVADHVMVGLKPGADEQAAKNILEQNGYRIRAVEPGSYILAELPDFQAVDDQQKSIADIEALNESIDYAEPDWIVNTCVEPNDPMYLGMWGLDNQGVKSYSVADADIDAPEAWNIRTDASNVIVAVTDTGIRYNHEDLVANMWSNGAGEHGLDAFDNDNDPMDPRGHGTHCAGTIGAVGNNDVGVTGIAWDVQLMAGRFIGSYGGAISDAIRVIDYAQNHEAHIISASWGGRGYSQSLYNKIRECGDAGIIFVAAAGNSSRNNDYVPHYPSSFNLPTIVAVAATNDTDELSYFSCFARYSVDIGAPGTHILSTYIDDDDPNANDRYSILQGTSMAAPHVSGALALARAQFPDDDAEELISRLYSSVDVIPALTGKLSTGGRLNLHKLLGASTVALSNDHFDNALRFDGDFGYWGGSNKKATRELDEDSFSLPNTGHRSLWYAWKAPYDGLITFSVESTDEPCRAIAFQGDTKQNLRVVSDSVGSSSNTAGIVRFYCKKDQEYRFVVDSDHGTAQVVFATLALVPPNDSIDGSFELSGDSFIATGSNRNATQESYEKNQPHGSTGIGKSVWWKWTPDFDGEFVVSTHGSSFDSVLAVHTRGPNGLNEVVFNDDRNSMDWSSQVVFHVTQGTTYYIVVDSYYLDSSGPITLRGFRSNQLILLSSPEDTIAKVGERLDFSVVALGARELSYQWKKNGIQQAWSTSLSRFVVHYLTGGGYGQYECVVSDGLNEVTVNWEVISPKIPPQIKKGIVDQIILTEGVLRYSPTVEGSEPLSYQWYKDSIPLIGQNGRELNFSNVNESDAGDYSFVVSNAYGSVTSDKAEVIVQGQGALKWLPVLPHPRLLSYNDGVSHAGILHLVTENGVWMHGYDINNLKINAIPGMRLIRGIRKHGQTLIAFGQDNYTYTGNRSGKLHQSIDGVTWQEMQTNLSASQLILDFASDGTTAVAIVGDELMYSTDLISWIPCIGITQSAYYGVEYSGGKFLAIRNIAILGVDYLQWATSDDGETWVEHSDIEARPDAWKQLFSANGRFYIPANGTSMTEDGVTWQHGLPGIGTSIIYQGSKYYTSSGKWSDDGVNWITDTFDYWHYDAKRIIYHNNHFILRDTNSGVVVELSDYFDPSGVKLPETGQLQNLNDWELPEPFIPVGGNVAQEKMEFLQKDTQERLVSSDYVYVGGFYWLLSGGDLWVGSTRKQMTPLNTPTIVSWTQVLSNMCVRGDTVIVTDNNKQIWYSHDRANTWSIVNSPVNFPEDMKFKATSNGFVGVGQNEVWYSSGGANWTVKYVTVSGRRGTASIVDLVVEANRVSALDEHGYIHTSIDGGVTWSTIDLGDDSWVSLCYWKGTPYVLNADGRLISSVNHNDWVTDAYFTLFSPGHDLEQHNGSLFVKANNMIFRAGELLEEGINSEIIGIEEGELFDLGQPLTIKWNASIQKGSVESVRVLVDGVEIHQSNNQTGEITYDSLTLGEHKISILVESSTGMEDYTSVIIHGRGTPLSLLTSSVSGNLVDTAFFEGAIYVAMEDGRIMRSGDGINWDLVMVSISKPHAMIANNKALVIACSRAIHVTHDGVNWSRRADQTAWTDHYQQMGFAATPYGRVMDGKLVLLDANWGSVVYSDDGLTWEEASVASPFENKIAEYANGVWIGHDKLDSILLVSSDTGSTPLLEDLVGEPVIDVVAGEIGFLVKTATRVLFSENGYDWSEVSGIPTNLGGIAYQSGYFFVEDTATGSYWASSNTLAWREVDRIPSVIDQGVWKTANASSLDGKDWVQEFDLDHDYELLGVLGDRRILKRSTTSGATVIASVGPSFGITETDLSELYREDHLRDIGIVNPLIFKSDDGMQHMFGSGKYITKSVEGLWSEPQTISGLNGHIVGLDNGLFYGYASRWMDVKVSTDGATWETKPITVSTTDDFSIKMVAADAGVLYVCTIRNVHRSLDQGESWQTIYRSTVDGMGSPDSIAIHNGQIFLALQKTAIQPLAYDEETSTWAALPGAPTVSGWAKVKSAGGFLYLVNGYNIHSTADLTNWHRQPKPETNGSLYDLHAIHDRLVVTYSRAGGYYSFVSDDNGRMQRATEYGQMKTSPSTTGMEGDTYAYRFINQTWQENGSHDLAVAEVSISESISSIVTPFEVNVALANRLDSNFDIQSGGVMKIWALHQGINNYQQRILLGEVDVSGIRVDAKSQKVISKNVLYPNDTPPGEFVIMAELSLSNSAPSAQQFDAIPHNNSALTRESMEFAACTLTTTTSGSGIIAASEHGNVYARGAQISLVANTGKGNTFGGWSGDAVGAESQITILMDGDRSVQANFSPRASLQVLIRGAGSVSGLADLGSYAVGDTATITSAPSTGWVFSGWSGAATGSTPTANITMGTNKVVTVTFIKPVLTWKSEHFTEAELQDLAIFGDDADPDGDGLKNWQEYLHLSDPRDAASKGVLELKVDGGFLYAIFTRNSGVEGGLSLACQGSRDMSDWDAADIQERLLSTVDGVETVEARIPADGKQTGFLRLRYNRP